MNILFVVPYAPTLIRTRPFNLIRHLARRGHSITLAALWEDEADWVSLGRLAAEGVRVLSARLTPARSALNVLGSLFSTRPLQAAFCWHPGLARLLQAECARADHPYDLVHVEHLRGARFGLYLKALFSRTESPPAVVWDSVDCISLLFELAARQSRSRFGRWAARLELPRTRRFEGSLVPHFDRVLATSPADQAALERLAGVYGALQPVRALAVPALLGGNSFALDLGLPGPYHARPVEGNVHVVPNGVDLGYFTPNFSARAPDILVFSGKMSYHANVTAALHLVDDIMPHVWKRRPDVRLNLVGKDPPRAVSSLMWRYPGKVWVTGYVADLRPHLWWSTLAVAPVRYGAGIQNKVLEAMACAMPVVATPQAASALQARAGEHLVLAERPEAFAAEVLRLLGDEPLRRQIGTAGRRYVRDHHNWDDVARNLEEVYRGCLSRTA